MYHQYWSFIAPEPEDDPYPDETETPISLRPIPADLARRA